MIDRIQAFCDQAMDCLWLALTAFAVLLGIAALLSGSWRGLLFCWLHAAATYGIRLLRLWLLAKLRRWLG